MKDIDERPSEAALHELSQWLKGIEIAMLTTVREDGTLHSRPMATQQVAFDGSLWFFTDDAAPKARELTRNPNVSLTYADRDARRYVMVQGRASIVHDTQKAVELWSPLFRPWFPRGLEDSRLALIRVQVDGAECWDAPTGRLRQWIGMAKAAISHEPYHAGRNEKLHLKPTG